VTATDELQHSDDLKYGIQLEYPAMSSQTSENWIDTTYFYKNICTSRKCRLEVTQI
jgi:hypothetical protein